MAALPQPGAHAVMRHALAPGTGVRFGAVLGSRWERCLETAALMEMGEVRPRRAIVARLRL